MDYTLILHLFPILLLLQIFYSFLEMRSSGYNIRGTRDWIFSYLFLFLFSIFEIFITDNYYLFGATISSVLYVTAFIYIEFSLSKYNGVRHSFLISLSSGFLLLVFGIVNWILKFDNGEILNIVYSIVLIIILSETLIYTRKTRFSNSKTNYFFPLCISYAMLIVYFILRIFTNFDFGIIHNDESSFIHTYLFITHMTLLISIALGLNYIYKWYYINELNKASEHQKSILEEVTVLSMTDELTKIYNRRHIEKLILNAMKEYNERNDNVVFSVAIIDIDKFKFINDNYGHKKGDDILVEFSKIIKDNLKQDDEIGRWGGDEFLILFSNTCAKDANICLVKILKIISETDFSIDFPLSFSYGVHEFDSSYNYDDFFRTVDHLLYAQKNSK